MFATVRYFTIAVFVLFLAWCGRHFVLDDSLIYARYIANALDGRGLVFNTGEHVNALTSPLFCYLLLGAAKLLHGNVLLASRLLYLTFLLGACVLAEKLARYAGVFVAGYAFFYAVQGMETSLFLMLLALAVLLYRDERWDWLPVVYVLLALARFEGALLSVILFGAQIWRRKFSRPVSFLPALLIVAAYCLLNLHWYGRVLPSSTTAKFGQGMSGYWGRWPTAFLHAGTVYVNGAVRFTVVIVPVVVILAVMGFLHARREKLTWATPVGLFLVGLFAFYLLFNLPSYHWYYAPFIFFAMIAAALAVPAGTKWGIAAMVTAVVVCAVNGHGLLTFGLPNQDYARADAWLLQHAPPGSRIATAETGLIGWQLRDYYIIDTVGLTTPENAVHTAHRQPGLWLAEDHPDFIFIHTPPMPWDEVVPGASGYVRLPVQFGQVSLYARQGTRIE